MTDTPCLHCLIIKWLLEQPWVAERDGVELIDALLEVALDFIDDAPKEVQRELVRNAAARMVTGAGKILAGTYKGGEETRH